MTADPSIVAAYRSGFARRAKPVKVTRVTGVAPNAVPFSVVVSAIVSNYTPDTTVVEQTGYATSKMGAITQGDRIVLLMGADLRDKGFPLPMQKHDKIELDGGDVLDVVEIDAEKRALADAIELKAVGVN